MRRYSGNRKRPRPFAGSASKLRGSLERKEGETAEHCGARYWCQRGHASVVAAFIHGVAADRRIGQWTGRTVSSRPLLKLLRSFLSRQCMLPSREHSALDHGKEIFLHGHAAGLRLREQPGFKLRVEIQGNHHEFPSACSLLQTFNLARRPAGRTMRGHWPATSISGLRVLVGRGSQPEPPLTGGIVSRVYFQKAIENFVSVIEIVQHEIGSREVEGSRPIRRLDLDRFFI